MSSKSFRDKDKSPFTMACMTLGQRIRHARDTADLSQQALGNLLGVTKAAVSGWERDESEPLPKNLRGLSRALNATVAWLINEEGPEPLSADDSRALNINRQLRGVQRATWFQFGDNLGQAQLDRFAS